MDEVFDRHSYGAHSMKEFARYTLFERMAKANINFITTHCYRKGYVSKTGLTDPKYVKTLQKKLEKLGAKFFPVHLKADNKELLRRVSMSSRKKFKKLKSKKIMRRWLLGRDWHTSPNLKNNFIVDNTNLSPEKVANTIIKHFRLTKVGK